LVALGTAAAKLTADSISNARQAEVAQLRDLVMTTFDKSVAACAVYQHASPDCIKEHFQRSYRWYVLGEKDFLIGPPGTPGPQK